MINYMRVVYGLFRLLLDGNRAFESAARIPFYFLTGREGRTRSRLGGGRKAHAAGRRGRGRAPPERGARTRAHGRSGPFGGESGQSAGRRCWLAAPARPRDPGPAGEGAAAPTPLRTRWRRQNCTRGRRGAHDHLGRQPRAATLRLRHRPRARPSRRPPRRAHAP